MAASGGPSQVPPPADGLGGWAEDLRSQFPAVFSDKLSASASKLGHGVEHFISTKGRPATAKFRRLDPVRLAAAKKEFQQMLDEGIIRRSSSQ